MSKTIQLPIVQTGSSSFGQTVPIDVDEFAAFAASLKRSPQKTIPRGRWTCVGLLCFGADGFAELTPRGEDLLASAHLLPDDPAPAKPVAKPCKGCNGTGEQMLLVTTHVCDRCEGSKTEPHTGMLTFVANSNALARAATALLGLSDSEGWTLINSEDVAKTFVGKWVEIDAPEVGYYAAATQHNGSARLLMSDRGCFLFPNGGAVDWAGRGNVRLRLAEPPQ